MDKTVLSNLSTSSNQFLGLKTEFVRKSIHFLIALVPSIAAINRPFAVLLLMAGTLSYTFMEYLRLSGVKIPVISSLTAMASRPRDMGKFVMGPVTLGIGALLALLLYPSPAATIAIYALAFGDGLASLAGRLCGRLRPSFLLGKSVEGTFVCFSAVFVSAFAVSGSLRVAAIAAVTAALIEVLPIEDYDNIAIPVTVGLVVQLVTL